MSSESGPSTNPALFHALYTRFNMNGGDVAEAAQVLEMIATSARAVVEGPDSSHTQRLAASIAAMRALLGAARTDDILRRLSIDPVATAVTDVTLWQNRIPDAPFPVVAELTRVRAAIHALADIALYGGLQN